MKHSVTTYRAAGLEAKWGHTGRGSPAMFVRHPSSSLAHQRQQWWMVTKGMYASMEKLGVVEGFNRHTLVGGIFSIPA